MDKESVARRREPPKLSRTASSSSFAYIGTDNEIQVHCSGLLFFEWCLRGYIRKGMEKEERGMQNSLALSTP